MAVENPPGEFVADEPQIHLGRAALNLVRDLLIAVVIGVALFLGVRSTLQHTLVQGPSMEPNFHDGQRVLVNTLAYRIEHPTRGDVLVFHFKYRKDQEPFIKRVVGLPGEEVEVRGGRVYVNGQQLTEPWVTNHAAYDAPPVKLGPGEYYVLGDNRGNSSDSHVWGPQPADLIIGKVWITIWPPQQWPVVGQFVPHRQPGT